MLLLKSKHAGVAELVDALDSKSSESNLMRVQVPPPAPSSRSKILEQDTLLLSKLRIVESQSFSQIG